MELEVQKYLRQGKSLSDLKNDFGIKNHEKDGLAILNYSQIDSPKTEPIVMECRGLTLDKENWDVVSMSFRRFFNYGEAEEVTKDFDFAKAHALEKVDGSLIKVFHYQGKWKMATRGTIDGVGPTSFLNMTFQDLFFKIVQQYPGFWDKLKPEFVYIFELVSPENKVVTPYEERSLYLLAARDRKNHFLELSYEELQLIAEDLKVRIPKLYNFQNIEEILKLAGGLESVEEGFVCVDYSQYDFYGISFPRVKVKNPAYVALAHLKNSCGASLRALMQLIMQGEKQEFLNYFPEYNSFVDVLEKKYQEFLGQVQQDIVSVQHLMEKEKTNENRKDFALTIKKMTHPGFMFEIYSGKALSLSGCIENLFKKKSEKSVAKQMLEYLKLENKEFTFEENS